MPAKAVFPITSSKLFGTQPSKSRTELPAPNSLEFNLHLVLCPSGRQRDMETTHASVINSSALYVHDRVAERGLAFFEELLRDFHPRNFAIRLWDGSSLDPEPGQYA